MTAVTQWRIHSLERNIGDGRVTQIDWSVQVTDGEYSVAEYGIQDLGGDVSVPYEEITEELCLNWLMQAMGQRQVDLIVGGLTSKVEELNNPVSAKGLPWE
jgi:hypothetical protein